MATSWGVGAGEQEPSGKETRGGLKAGRGSPLDVPGTPEDTLIPSLKAPCPLPAG